MSSRTLPEHHPVDEPLLVGLDIGTTHIKAAAFRLNGQLAAAARCATPFTHPRPGWGEMDPEALWQHCLSVLERVSTASRRHGVIAALAVTGTGEAGVPLTAAGTPAYPSLAWYDTRTQAQADFIAGKFGAESVFEACGQTPHPIFSVCKLLWIKEHAPEAYARIATWLSLSDYVAWRLSGIQAMEYSQASRTMALNVVTRQWNAAFLQELGLSPNLMPDLVPSGHSLGPLSPSVARALDMPTSTQVVTGGHDHVCAALALGATAPDTLLDSMGGAEGIFLPLRQPLTQSILGAHGYSQGIHVTGENYLMAGLYTSGVVVDWFRACMAPQADYEDLIQQAQSIPAGSGGIVFLPHLRLAGPGYLDSRSRGAYVGLTADTTLGTLFRATLEGMAFEAHFSLAQALRLGVIPAPETIILTGGGTRNELLLRIKASIMNRTLHVTDNNDATVLGAAALAGLGAELYPSHEDASRTVRPQHAAIPPDASEVDTYDRLFASVYRRLYRDLAPMNHALFDLSRAPS